MLLRVLCRNLNIGQTGQCKRRGGVAAEQAN
jgi:hypothetical protein